MAKIRSKQKSRNEKISKHNSQIIKIRDWLGFFFTIAGVYLSLSGSVHIDIQIQYSTLIEIYNISSEGERTQWNSGDFLLGPKNVKDVTNKDNADKKKYPIEWAYINLSEYPQDTLKRKKQIISHKNKRKRE